MFDLQRHISMCTRHHAKWKRMVSFARTEGEREKYLERARFWLDMQSTLVSLWSMEQRANGSEARNRLADAKSRILTKMTGYGRELSGEI